LCVVVFGLISIKQKIDWNDRAFLNTFSLPPFSLPSIYCYFIAFVNPPLIVVDPFPILFKKVLDIMLRFNFIWKVATCLVKNLYFNF